jgi:hypothetical protein
MQMKAVLFSGLIAVIAGISAQTAYADYRFDFENRHTIRCFGGTFSNHCGFGVGFRDDSWERLNYITCDEARRILSDRGYTKIKTVKCKGVLFVFTARWKGASYELKVDRSSGDLRSARKI